MKRKSQSQRRVVEFDIPELEASLDQIERTMGEPTSRPFRLLLAAHLSLLQSIQERDISIQRLRRMLFGASTERTRDAAAGTNTIQRAAAAVDRH